MISAPRFAVRSLLSLFALAASVSGPIEPARSGTAPTTAATCAETCLEPTAPDTADAAVAGIRSEGRLRKLHLVRPDLIPYPIAYEVYC